ncbi:MAG: ABC transporter ATP-binding protein [Pirellulales bacterium]
MKNFGRVLRLALGYPWTIAGIVLSSLVVAALWGGNIGVLYPVVEVSISGQSLQQWVDKKIDGAAVQCQELEAKLAQVPASAPENSRTAQLITDRLAAERQALATYQRLRPLIYDYLPTVPYRTLLVMIGGLMVATIIKDSLLVVNLLLVERLGQLVLLDLRKLCYRATLDMDLSHFHDQSTGKYLSHFTTDASAVTAGLTQLFGTSIREPLKMIACLAIAAWICWPLLVLSLLCAPLAGYLIRRLSQSIKRSNRRALEQNSHYFQSLTETFSGILTIKAYTMERFERTRFHKITHEMFRKAMRSTLYASLTNPIVEILGIGIIALALMSGAYLVLHQETHLLGIRMCDRPLTFTSLLIFYGMLAGASDPARKMSGIYGTLQGAFVAADRTFEFLDQQPSIADPAAPREAPVPFRQITLDNVSFSYQPGQPILRDVQLTIQAGETLAIVGPNGCGKSTLINLLPRFYEPTSGAIRLDGIDIRELRLRDLREQLGIVTQQTQLFNDTVINNIRYGRPAATDAEVVAAAQQAHAHQFIVERLEFGYETVVGQGGAKLSGGQRQRIALARAMLRNPALLILDEATSQVDLESEHLIHRALEKFIVGRTAIMITHRLSTLELADRVLVMDQGRIVDCGTHQELTARCEVYRRLYELQFRHSA